MNRQSFRFYRNHTALFFIALLALLLFRTQPAQAHIVYEVGSYSILASWELEPPVVGERNTLDVFIYGDNGATPIDADIARLSLSLVQGGVERPVAVAPDEEPTLRYRITFVPTVPGDYQVHLRGTLGDESVDTFVAPETVEATSILQFPEIALSDVELGEGLILVEQQVQAARQQATNAMIVGGVGTALGVGGIVSGRMGRGKSAES